jgi:hypothetical protein
LRILEKLEKPLHNIQHDGTPSFLQEEVTNQEQPAVSEKGVFNEKER